MSEYANFAEMFSVFIFTFFPIASSKGPSKYREITREREATETRIEANT